MVHVFIVAHVHFLQVYCGNLTGLLRGGIGYISTFVVSEFTRNPLWNYSPIIHSCLLFILYVIDCQNIAFNSGTGGIFLRMSM